MLKNVAPSFPDGGRQVNKLHFDALGDDIEWRNRLKPNRRCASKSALMRDHFSVFIEQLGPPVLP